MPSNQKIFEEKRMDTRVTVTIHPGRTDRDWEWLASLVFGVFADLEKRFSLFRPESEICRVNAAAGRSVPVSGTFLSALGCALRAAQESGGAFDPLVGRLTAPAGAALAAGRRPSFREVNVDKIAGCLTLPPGGVLDLNSVVRGTALDLTIGFFNADEAVMIAVGGDLRLKGLPPGRPAWDVGIRDPRQPHCLIAVLPVRSGAVCTSGEHCRSESACTSGFCHLIDPRSDARPTGAVASMTVLAATAQEADVLSTAAYVLPPAEAVAFVERHEGASCLFVDSANQVFASPRLNRTLYTQTHV